MVTSAVALLAFLGFALCVFLGSRTGFASVIRASAFVQRAGSTAEQPAIPKSPMPSMLPSTADATDRVTEAAHARALGTSWEPFAEITKAVGPSRQWWWQPMEFLVVVSEMRSGSTNLTMELARRNLCLYDCNEFFDNTAAIPCLHAVKAQSEEARREAPLATMKAARDHLCSKRMPKCWHNTNVPMNVTKECSLGCGTTIKLFHQHGVHTEKLFELMKYGGTRVIVLERDPAKRKCSLDWAMQKGDWGVDPSEHKKKGLGKRPPCPAQAPADFLKEHQDWYGEVRWWLNKHEIPRLEVNFDAYMATRADVLKEIMLFAGM